MPSSGGGTGTPVSGVQQAFESLPFLSAVWVWDNSAAAYVNNTVEAQTSAGTAFSIFEDTADYLYLGSESRFDLVLFVLSTLASIGALTWQYYNGSSWIRFIPSHEYDFTYTGADEWRVRELSNWASLAFSATNPHAATPPDTTTRYWIRISVASVTTAPTVLQIESRPYAAYCTATDVANLLQLDGDFSSTTTPSRNTVEDYINAAQSYMEYKTQKAWRTNVKYNEHHEFNMGGFKLIERDIRRILRVRVWNGSNFELRTEGRTSDYFLVPQEGMVYWSRYFLLPARFQSYNAPVWIWGWGEFNSPVVVDYIYGRRTEADPKQGQLAWDIARKKVAIDVFQSHDYSILAASGSDKVPLEQKLRNWYEEINEQLESLRGWVMM